MSVGEPLDPSLAPRATMRSRCWARSRVAARGADLPVSETRLLIQTLTSRWYDGTTKGGQVVKDAGPFKPNRLWEGTVVPPGTRLLRAGQ